ncbi:rhodanese-like domain-containing protein [Shimia abyssi]|uniref:Rhodanese-related sulfurtransferase n=1 Tax=Shimia abyssi TaxID=1662395 RepID=A0A2P8FBF3_9RHOB|nr:rhodanese-like domain-containing protein [Shimia abyssi]PSL19063.1 rhodanese-related sulfurtransferase [Shimia abyssi]
MLKTRRWVIGGMAGAAGVGVAYTLLARIPKSGPWMELSPPEALQAVQRGELLIIDIRRPDEWQRTGLAQGAVPIDMRRGDFISALNKARASIDQPIAVICARGVRSNRMANQMHDAGIGPIFDIPEGMLGSGDGPGWIQRGLPLTEWTEQG